MISQVFLVINCVPGTLIDCTTFFFKYVSILVDFLPFRSFPIIMSYFGIKVLIGSSQRKVYANQIHETKATSVCLFDMGFLHFDEYLLL